MRRNIDAYQQKEVTAQQLADSLSDACHALEGMPYQLIKELDGLLLRLEQSSQGDESGFQSQSLAVVEEFSSKLDRVPLDV